ncbi:nudix hydrolase 10-like [Eucalyptus grandis]|uniref:nudix hydrolase 10-like n=1 Tax=Eucalyptus grandis TaxID=71139 RepID=UPI00192E93E7|nr:nudix hydrolase 10-like [Eucalyptus grandis]
MTSPLVATVEEAEVGGYGWRRKRGEVKEREDFLVVGLSTSIADMGLAPRVPSPQLDTKSIGATSALRQGMAGNNNSGIQQIQLLNWHEDSTGGVTVVMKERMDAGCLCPLASELQYQPGNNRGRRLCASNCSLNVQISLEGFRYHHSEASYSVFVPWLPLTPNLIPVNASHGVLVVPENSGRFKGMETSYWSCYEDEDICHAVARVAKEETGVDTKFVEVLYFRQDHKSFFPKSDLSFLCVLQPQSSSIEEQNLEVRAAQDADFDMINMSSQ